MNLFLPYALASPFSLMMRQTWRRLTVTPDLPGDSLYLARAVPALAGGVGRERME